MEGGLRCEQHHRGEKGQLVRERTLSASQYATRSLPVTLSISLHSTHQNTGSGSGITEPCVTLIQCTGIQ